MNQGPLNARPRSASPRLGSMATLVAAVAACAASQGAWAAYASVSGYGGRVIGTYEATASDNLRQASADVLAVAVTGQLQGPFPGSLTAGEPVEAGNGTDFTVFNIQASTPLTFTWQMVGSHTGVADDSSFALYFSFGMLGGMAQQIVGQFGGLSYVDGPAWAGDFAGSATGQLGCFVASSANGSTQCPAAPWDGQGTLTMSAVNIFSDGWGGSIGQSVSMSGAGADTHGDYRLVLSGVSMPAGSGNGQGSPYIQFANGQLLAITSAVPEPAAPALLAAGLLALGLWRRSVLGAA